MSVICKTRDAKKDLTGFLEVKKS